MGLITGITGAAAEFDAQASPLPEPAAETPIHAESELPTSELSKSEPGPGLEERSFSLVGRAMRFVMKTITPGVWLSVIQEMAGQMPPTIALEPTSEASWEHEARHAQFVEDLRDQGFVDAGLFKAVSVTATVHLLVNEAYDIRAVVYERYDSGIVLDLVTLYGDGTGVTYVNREDPGYEQSPLHPNIYLGDVPVFELLDTCLRDRPKKARLPVTAENAPKVMELEYQFGAKRLRGEPVNPVEIADAYLEVIGAGTAEPSPPLAESEDVEEKSAGGVAAGKIF